MSLTTILCCAAKQVLTVAATARPELWSSFRCAVKKRELLGTTALHEINTKNDFAGKHRVDNKNAKKKCVLLAQGEGGHGGHPKLAQ
jgi:hypothetical protein